MLEHMKNLETVANRIRMKDTVLKRINARIAVVNHVRKPNFIKGDLVQST